MPHYAAHKMSSDSSPQSQEQSSESSVRIVLKGNERPTARTALRDLERKQFDALEAAQLRDLDR
jgi:hypothetical protein